jgi:hypothetical protein
MQAVIGRVIFLLTKADFDEKKRDDANDVKAALVTPANCQVVAGVSFQTRWEYRSRRESVIFYTLADRATTLGGWVRSKGLIVGRRRRGPERIISGVGVWKWNQSFPNAV